VIPVIVSGTLQHPRFAPDMQKVAQMKLKGLMPNFNNPSAGMAGLLGSLAGQKGGNQTQQQQQQPNPVQQIMDLFGGKKKKQPPPQK
jgi:hypothetical protein